MSDNDNQENAQRDFLKLYYKSKILKKEPEDPAEVFLPLLAFGCLAVVGGSILVSMTVGESVNLAVLGAAIALGGVIALTLALVLVAVSRGKKRIRNKKQDN